MKSTDPSKPLENARHEAFAVHYALNGNASKAWMETGGDNPKTGNVQGSKWLKRGGILERVRWLKAEAARIHQEWVDKQNAPPLLDLIEKRKFLARVMRTPVGDIDETSDLCQSVEIGDKGGRKYKMPCKISAIKLDNDLAGEGSEAKAADSLTTYMQKVSSRV